MFISSSSGITSLQVRRPLARLLVLAGVGAALAACKAKEGTDPTCEVTGLSLAPATAEVDIGATVALAATVTQEGCNPVPTVTWASSLQAVATVAQSGVVTGVSAGTTTITAVAGGRNASAIVTVRQAAVASVQITTANPTVAVGLSVQLTAVTRDAAGNALTGRSVAWQTLQPGIVTVGAATGLATGVSPGTGTVTATSEGRTTSVTVTVTPVPVASVSVSPLTLTLNVNATGQLGAITRDAQGNSLVRAVAWSSSAEAIATVSGAGLVTAVAPGQAVITATSEGRTGTATVTVNQLAVGSITLVLSSQQLSVGQNTQAAATVRDALGGVITGRTVAFSTTAPAVASVTSTGAGTATVVALGAGTATISATLEGVTATQNVTVVTPVAAVTLNQSTATLGVGGTVQLVATPRDGQGNALTGRGMAWSVQPAGVVTLTQDGLVTAVAAGAATVTATSEGQSASAAVTVTAGVPVASVTLSQASATLVVGGSVTLVATPRDAQGNPLARPVTWATLHPAVASVSLAGLVNALAVGTATITATSEGQSASATITVQNTAVASIQDFTIPPTEGGTTRTITVVPKDASGNALTNRVCSWSSSLVAVATVTTPGMTTTLTVLASVAVNTQVTITVTCEGVSFLAPFTATAIPVATVTVTHDSAFLAVGEKGLARVTLRSAQGAILTGRGITWTLSTMARAIIPPGSGWTLCANEGGACSFAGTKQVRYGTNNTYFYRQLTGGTGCNNAVFGDPVVGLGKQCWHAELGSTVSGAVGPEVTALATGAVALTATPVVNPNAISGSVAMTVVPEFRVVTAEAVPNGSPASIETTDVLTFTNAISLGTFTTTNVNLRVTGGSVVPPSSTSNAAPNVYGYYVLHNEATNYTFSYTAGLRDIYGKSLKNPGSFTYATAEMDPAYYYRITSDFAAGSGRSLAIDPMSLACVMAPTNTSDPQQRWYTFPDPNLPTHYQLRNQFYGGVRALEAGTGGVPCRMDLQGNFTGQYWYTALIGGARWRLHSELENLTRALDQDGATFVPYMAPVGNFSGQFISFTRLARR